MPLSPYLRVRQLRRRAAGALWQFCNTHNLPRPLHWCLYMLAGRLVPRPRYQRHPDTGALIEVGP